MTAAKSNRQKTREKFERRLIDEIRRTGGTTSLRLCDSPSLAKAARRLIDAGVITMEKEGFPNYRCTIDEDKAARL